MESVVGVEKTKLRKLVIHEFDFRLAFDRDVVFHDICPLICVVESRRGAVAWAIRPKGGRPMKRMALVMGWEGRDEIFALTRNDYVTAVEPQMRSLRHTV